MEINELARQAFGMAKEKGWHDGPGATPVEKIMLVVTECAEACEEVRNNKPPIYVNIPAVGGSIPKGKFNVTAQDVALLFFEDAFKPEGEAVELADAVIRIADIFESRGWNLEAVIKAKMAYNATRPHRHGGKAL